MGNRFIKQASLTKNAPRFDVTKIWRRETDDCLKLTQRGLVWQQDPAHAANKAVPFLFSISDCCWGSSYYTIKKWLLSTAKRRNLIGFELRLIFDREREILADATKPLALWLTAPRMLTYFCVFSKKQASLKMPV